MIFRILIDGDWREAAGTRETFKAVNPATLEPLPGEYPVSGRSDIEAALEAALPAVDRLRTAGPDTVAAFLEAFAAAAEARRDDLFETARLETALPVEPRLRSVEFPRLADQVRQAAEACRDRSWCRAVIDSARNIRSRLGPLGGPVVVFSPNNFPFAFNAVGGGDWATALAAGNPVISKANPAHPGTTRILAEAARDAAHRTGLPRGAVQLLYHFEPGDGLGLVAHPAVGASAFTGSRPAGLRLKEAADRAGKPIYLEMASVNPVFLLPEGLKERPSGIAAELFASCLLGAGQFCTKPGLVVLIESASGREFLAAVKAAFEKAEPGYLLTPGILDGLEAASRRLRDFKAELLTGGRRLPGPGLRFTPTLFRVSGSAFLMNPAAFQAESFGSLSLVVAARDPLEMLDIAAMLEGQLTATVYSHSAGEDDRLYDSLEPILRRKAGRLLNDRMPTGVTVSPAMNHGGPFPAAGHPGFTSVGIPAAMPRFAALQCYDNVRPGRLPAELRDRNPTGKMWRFIDGAWTQRSL